MIRVNISEIKANLSRYLRRVAAGEVVRICRRDVPVAELRAVSAPPDEPRVPGWAKGEFTVPAAFHPPLPGGILKSFEGGGA